MAEERKLVTVLFADVTGSTALGEDLDPEDVRALMGQYYVHARQVISDHGGTLEKFIGDAVMAVFGLPHAHGDDAERAAAAALALQRAVRDDPVIAEMALRIGINTGEVVTTSDPSRGDFLVTGDAVNVAARLQQHANPGEILASERTHAATAAAVHFGEEREVEVKGKREPLRVFPLLAMRSRRQVERPPLVGRKRDLMQLALLQERALEEHRPQLVSIVAPAGTGKTRLLEEFLAGLDPGTIRVATSRCPPYGQKLAYWPLRGLLEGLVDEIARYRVVDALERGGYSPDDAARLTDLVLASLGIESEVLTERESIFGAWRILIETLARQAPHIVVFEDLHWASDSLLDLVEHVMHPRTKAPILVVAISRPDLLDRRPAWGGGRQSFTTLVLEPLTTTQTEALVAGLGNGLPHSIRQRIVERSGGNPFFATELVRGLADRGISGNGTDVSVVPDTVHAAVLARLDALSPDERAVVQAASVIGRSFRTSTLAAVVSDLVPGGIGDALDGLVARDMAMAEEGGAYSFRHILIRDIAYGTLSRSERIRMHAAVAAWTEGYAVERIDEFATVIAYHYKEAALLSQRFAVSVQLPFDLAHAVSFLERAGELASRSGAIAEARDYLQSAVAICPETDRGRLHEKLGDCAVFSSIAPEAYNQALEHWRSSENRDPLIGARILCKLVTAYTRWGLSGSHRATEDGLAEMLQEAQWLAAQTGDEDEIWHLRVASVFVYLHQLVNSESRPIDVPQLQQLALDAAAYFEGRGDWESFSAALDAHMGLSNFVGLHDAVIEVGKRRLAVPHLTLTERGDAQSMVAWSFFCVGQYRRCIDFANSMLESRTPDESLVVASGVTLVWACLSAYFGGDWTELQRFTRLVEDARVQFRDDPGFSHVVGAYMFALHLALARDDRPAADAAVATIRRLEPDGNDPARSMIPALLQDDPRKLFIDPVRLPNFAIAYVGWLALFVERGVPPPTMVLERAIGFSELGKIDALTRLINTSHALVHHDAERLSTAIEDAEAHGLIPHAARMRIVLAGMTRDPTPLLQARPVLERLEDRQFLRKLEEVASSLG